MMAVGARLPSTPCTRGKQQDKKPLWHQCNDAQGACLVKQSVKH